MLTSSKEGPDSGKGRWCPPNEALNKHHILQVATLIDHMHCMLSSIAWSSSYDETIQAEAAPTKQFIQKKTNFTTMKHKAVVNTQSLALVYLEVGSKIWDGAK